MEIKLTFEDEEEDFIKAALETWLQMMSNEVLDREKLLKVVIACGLSCAYEYKNPEHVDDLVENICVRLKNSLVKRVAQSEVDSDSSDGENSIH